MKFDYPPTKEPKGKDFEEIKKEFSRESTQYIRDLLLMDEEDKNLDFLNQIDFGDQIKEKINQLSSTDEEKIELTKIFIDQLTTFLNQMDCSKYFNKVLLSDLHSLLYGKNTILDNLDSNLTSKILVLSKMNEVFVFKKVNEFFQERPAEITEDIISCDQKMIEELIEKIKKLPVSQILSVVKMFQSSYVADENEPYKKSSSKKMLNIINSIGRDSESPLVSLACDMNDLALYDRTPIKESLEKENDSFNVDPLSIYSDEFFSSVSSDYVSLVDEWTLIPFSLIKKTDLLKHKYEEKEYEVESYENLTKKKELNSFGDEDFSHSVKFLHNPQFRMYINKTLGIKIESSTLNEQIYFLKFLSASNKKVFNKLEKTLKNKNRKENSNFLRSFLSMSGNSEMGDKILELGDKLPEDIAKKVFVKYGEIIDSADKAEEEVKNLYKKDNIPNKVFESIKETLLKRGVKLLSNLADNIKENTNIDEQEILEKLEDIKTQTIIMGSSYVELHKQGIKIPIEDISNTSVEKISAQNFTKKEKQELLEAYEKGHPKETYENKDHIKLLRDEFEGVLNNKDTFVFNIRFNNEIVAFATFNKEGADTLHIGGLTFIEDVRNPAIAVAVMNSIMKEFGNFNIKALVHSKNKILNMYQNRFGFKITKMLDSEKELKENAGELYYEIERPKDIEKEETLEEESEFKKAA